MFVFSSCSGKDISGFTIQLGVTRRYTHTYLGKKMKVKGVFPHPRYNPADATHDNDVALLQVFYS